MHIRSIITVAFMAFICGLHAEDFDFEKALQQAQTESKDLLIVATDLPSDSPMRGDEITRTFLLHAGLKSIPNSLWPKDSPTQSLLSSNSNLFAVCLVDSSGKVYGRKLLSEAGISKLAESLPNEARKHAIFLQKLRSVEKLDGEMKIRGLDELAESLSPALFIEQYPQLAIELTQGELAQKFGFKLKYDELAKKASAKSETAQLQFKLALQLQKLGPEVTPQDYLAAIDNFITAEHLEGSRRQPIEMRKYLFWAQRGEFDEALKILEEVRMIDPASELSTRIPKMMENIKARKAAK